MKVGTSIKRRTRVRKVWVAKEEFACKKCGAEDIDIGYEEKEKILYCKKCGHKLTEKEELEEELIFNEIQQYGFWIRFVKEHFVPCKKCQDKLHISLFRNGTWYINDGNMGVDFAIFGRQCYFSIRWLTKLLYSVSRMCRSPQRNYTE